MFFVSLSLIERSHESGAESEREKEREEQRNEDQVETSKDGLFKESSYSLSLSSGFFIKKDKRQESLGSPSPLTHVL